jgi:CBS domain containing-hemolysin-like protein
MSQLLFGLTIGGLVMATFSAITAWIISEIAWHELEEYCKLKKRPELFGRIFELREPMLLEAGILQNISMAIFATSLSCWLLDRRGVNELTLYDLTSIIVLVAFFMIFSGSWIPWAVARIGSVQFLYRTWRWWWIISALAWPLMVGGRFLSNLFARASGHSVEADDEEEAFEDEILSMVSEAEHDGYLESEARDMIEGVMELDDNDVRSVMTPRSRVDAMELATNWEDMMFQVVESGRTRIPIYEEKFDNIVGILYAKDLLRESLRSESKRRPLNRLLRKPLAVPETTLLDEMLSQFLHARTHMAIVQDEYGGLAGVVTIEDVLEEIVGEIVDETDKDRNSDITLLNPAQADVEGSVNIQRINEELGIDLPGDENYDTVSGLIMHVLNDIPRVGHELVVGNVQFNIQEANRRQIKSVRVTILEADTD